MMATGGFSHSRESHVFAGFLFDLDGTIINSTDAVTKHWEKSVDTLSHLMVDGLGMPFT